MFARSFRLLIFITESHITQLYPRTRTLWAAIKIHGDFRRRRAMNILIRYITNFDPGDLPGAPDVSRTVVLINNNRVLDIVHRYMLKDNIFSKTITGSPPRFDPRAILGSSKADTFNRHVLYAGLVRVFSETPDAYAVAGAASHVFDPESGSAGADGDAVVAGGDGGGEDGDMGWHLDVDSVGVGADAGGWDFRALKLHVVAAVDNDVKYLAV